jgi:molybdate transport system ATP-binding protein
MSTQFRFKVKRGDFALDFDVEIPSRGVTALFGPSGSGKTSALRSIAGLEFPDPGYVQVEGKIWQDSKKKIFLPTHLRELGYVVQETALFPHLTVQGNLNYAIKRAPQANININEIKELLGISHFLDRFPDSLSGGERQRVAIARSLLTDPQILLFDEPLSALDFVSKNEIIPYFERLQRELRIPVLYVTHAVDEVMRLADFMVVMDKGRVSATGPIQQVITRLDLPISYGNEAGSIFTATVMGQDEEFHLTNLSFSGGQLYIPSLDLERGESIRVRIPADDVSFTLSQPSDTSILNNFPVSILDIQADPKSPAKMIARAKAGDEILLAKITRKSADALGLTTGKELFAQVKSVVLVGSQS